MGESTSKIQKKFNIFLTVFENWQNISSIPYTSFTSKVLLLIYFERFGKVLVLLKKYLC